MSPKYLLQIGSPQAAGRRTKRKRGKPFDFPLFVGVRWARLELAQDYSHYPLKVACLPFHHHRFFCFGIAKVRQNFKPANFFATFLQKTTNFFPLQIANDIQTSHFQPISLQSHFYLLSLHAFPREGKHRQH